MTNAKHQPALAEPVGTTATPTCLTPAVNEPDVPIAPEDTLYFKGHPIRILLVEGVPWFALPDLCDALGYWPSAMAAVDGSDFPACAKDVCDEEPDDTIPGQPAEVVILSPVGVWWFTELTNATRGQAIASWAKRETTRLCPHAQPGDPAVFLRLLPDGSLPPYPCKYSGRKGEWINLKESDKYVFRHDTCFKTNLGFRNAPRFSHGRVKMFS